MGSLSAEILNGEMKIGLVLPIFTITRFVNLKFSTDQIFLITVKSVIWSLREQSTLVCQYICIVADQLAL